MFQNDGGVRVSREAHEALEPSCIAPTVQAFGGSVMIGGVLHMVAIRFGNLVQHQNEISRIFEHPR